MQLAMSQTVTNKLVSSSSQNCIPNMPSFFPLVRTDQKSSVPLSSCLHRDENNFVSGFNFASGKQFLFDLHASFCTKMRQKEKFVFGFSFVVRSDNSVFFSTLVEAVFCRVRMGDDDDTLSSSYKA
jgi:hypothetical protein